MALEYRPKLRDFATSVGFERFTLRTDDLAGLEELVRAALAERERSVTELAPRVDDYRSRLRRASARLATIMGV